MNEEQSDETSENDTMGGSAHAAPPATSARALCEIAGKPSALDSGDLLGRLDFPHTRDGNGATPIHMGLPTHTYPLPAAGEPIAAALRKAEGKLQFWLEHAREGDMGECARQTMDVLKAVRAVLPMQCKAEQAEVLLNKQVSRCAQPTQDSQHP